HSLKFDDVPALRLNSLSLILNALSNMRLSGVKGLNLLLIIVLNLIAVLTGYRILRWFRIGFDSNICKIVFSISIGWAVYSMGIFYLGVFCVLYKWVIYSFIGLLGILSIFEARNFLDDWKRLRTTGNKSGNLKVNKADLVFLPIISIFLFIPFVTSFSPVSTSDAIEYHMALPKIYLIKHALVHIQGNWYSTLPAATEMLYLLGLAVSNDTLSKLFSFSITIMFFFSLFYAGTRFFTKSVGYLSIIVFLTINRVFFFYSEPWVDISFTLFSLLGVFAFLNWLETRNDPWLYLSVLCCGFTASIKFHGLFIICLFVLGFFIMVEKDKRFFKRLLWCALLGGIVSLPWYVRSWILTGNPVFPLFRGLFEARHWSASTAETFQQAYLHTGLFSRLQDFLLFTAGTFFPGLAAWYTTPLIFSMFLIPAFVMFRQWNRWVKFLLIAGFLQYVFTFFSSPNLRFMFPCFAMLSLVVGYSAYILFEKYKFLRMPIIASFTIFIAIGLFKGYRMNEIQLFVGLGSVGKEEFLTKTYRGLYDYDITSWVNKHLPKAGSKILSWKRYNYYLDIDYMCAVPTLGPFDFSEVHDADSFYKYIQGYGITHLFYSSYPWTREGKIEQSLTTWVRELAQTKKIKLLKRGDKAVIYVLE
ncbi:MAG: ArnT family glycosyltransferase, partial [Candidatus Brocadiales bacterium]